MKYDQDGYPYSGKGKHPFWVILGRPSVCVLDDRVYVTGRGNDSKVYICSTRNFSEWDAVGATDSTLPTVGSHTTPVAPTMTAFAGKLHLMATDKDQNLCAAEVTPFLDKDKHARGTVSKNWYKIAGTTSFSPSLVVFRGRLTAFHAGSTSDSFWADYSADKGVWDPNWVRAATGAHTSGLTMISSLDDKMYQAFRGPGNIVTWAKYGVKNESPVTISGKLAQGDIGLATFKGRLYISYSTAAGSTAEAIPGKL